MPGGFDGCYSSVLVLHGEDEDEEYNVNTTSLMERSDSSRQPDSVLCDRAWL